MSLRTIIKTKPALLLVTSRSCQHGIGRVPLLSLQHRRGAAMFENTPVITPGMPGYTTHVQNKTVITIEEAVYQMPENAGKSTFHYTKLPFALIPRGWSNHPAHLEQATTLFPLLSACNIPSFSQKGLCFSTTALPVLITLHEAMNRGDYDYIEWFLFQAKGLFYLRHGVEAGLRRAVKPVGLEDILKKIKTEGIRGLEYEMCEEVAE